MTKHNSLAYAYRRMQFKRLTVIDDLNHKTGESSVRLRGRLHIISVMMRE